MGASAAWVVLARFQLLFATGWCFFGKWGGCVRMGWLQEGAGDGFLVRVTADPLSFSSMDFLQQKLSYF